MALKDLVAQKSALDEAAIEEIVQDYVRFDPEERDIVFLPEFNGLSGKQKILVYLVALLGWTFVVDEPVDTDTKPANLEEKLSIPGGSLRPMLKDLKDRHLLVSKGVGYSVRASSLPAIKRELAVTPGTPSPSLRKRRSAAKVRTSGSAPAADVDSEGSGEQPRKRKSASGPDVKGTFRSWIAEGYFKDARTLADVQARFHQEAILIPRTSIPKYLLSAIRDKSLYRSKDTINGRTVWVYSDSK